MKKLLFSAAIALQGILLPHLSTAQATGSFDSSITFMGAPRQLSCYVPATYTSSTAYRLIVGLHGLGDNSVAYRNGLVSSLGWGSSIPNTIFVCPEGSNVNADFYVPAGDEEVIQASIDFAMSHYHIDTADVVLQGFSLGGRAALRYGLDNYTKFKGLLLTTPAVQGVKEAINENGDYTFTYANAPHIPIYITHGSDDVIYESPIDTAYEWLVRNNGIVRYYQFPGIGHAIPPIASMLNFIPYFDTPAVAGYDVDMVKTTIAQRSCSTTLPATFLLRNTGRQTINSITLSYNIGGAPLTYTWTGTLNPFASADVALPAIAASAGSHTLTVTVASVNAGITDPITDNNTTTAPFQVVSNGHALPLTEGFEGSFPPADWVQYRAGDIYSAFDVDNTVAKTGTSSMGAFNTILIFNNSGRKEEMASPVLNLTTVASPQLRFDVAYNYHHYAPPVLTIDTSFADTLEVLISTDCGGTYTSLYKKGGADLATFPSPILNPTTIDADFISPAATNWRTETVDLSSYSGSDKAVVKFRYISALGGSINIDNVNFAGPTGIATIPAIHDVLLYPNPASGIVNISAAQTVYKATVTDGTGNVVMSMDNNSNALTVNTAQLATGVYVFRLFTGNDVVVRKVTIVR